jgi:uncharacterized protein (TIGR02001 family)
MKKIVALTSVALAVAAFHSGAQAQSATPAPAASPHTLSYNVGLVTDYRYRGVSQSFRSPALQGGADYSHASGFYLGAWASTIKLAGNGVEVDLYGGYKFEVAKDVTLDVGLLQYWYPGDSVFNTLEVYAGATYKWISAKYSISLGDKTFGFPGSRGSGYLDLTATVPIQDGLNLIAHLGNQTIKKTAGASYTDYKLGVTYDAYGATWGAALIGTNKDFPTTVGTKTRKIGASGIVLSVAKTF